jgi:hypothetical protein
MKARPWYLTAFFFAAFVLGVVLRLTWIEDMEYKGDERWMFDRSQHVGIDEPWPELGMSSGPGLRHPGMSVWVFAVIARVFGATTPLTLDRAIITMNILGLALLYFFALKIVDKKETEIWLWAGALVAVNPMALLLERKIWATNVLPLFIMIYLIGWWRRDRYWGALIWAALGSVLAQLHMSGFFYCAAFAGWDLAFGGKWRPGHKSTKWLGAIVGAAATSYPLLPWIAYVRSGVDKSPPYNWDNVESVRFFRQWYSDAAGFGFDYNLGSQFADFLRYPKLSDKPIYDDLYPNLFVQGICFTIVGYIVLSALLRLWRKGLPISQLMTTLRECSDTAFTACAAFFGYGTLITFFSIYIWRHYMVISFPLEWVSVTLLAARYVRRPRTALVLLWGAQLWLSVSLLHFIHDHHGALGGDYGPSYGSQYGSHVR